MDGGHDGPKRIRRLDQVYNDAARTTTAPVDYTRPMTNGVDQLALEVHDLQRIGYADAYAEQVRYRDALIEARRDEIEPLPPMHLLLLEHDPPVITVSRRPTAGQHLVASPERLRELGIEVAETDRGGDITYHGPGQIVGYAILDLKRLQFGVNDYMRWLEQIVIDTLAEFSIQAQRDDEATGVWVGTAGPTSAKICALGVRVSRWITMHGLALNVCTDLSHFETIVPCGLTGRPVTSMHRVLGEGRGSDIAKVKQVLAETFQRSVRERMSD